MSAAPRAFERRSGLATGGAGERGVRGLLLTGAALLLSAAVADATVCSDICTGTTGPCVVNGTKTVAPGSVIDCGTRALQVTNGSLVVHDGSFVLRGGSLTVSGSGNTITADCPAGVGGQGFAVQVIGTISITSAGSMKASCNIGGGAVSLKATSTVSIGGTGIKASGTAQNSNGGRIDITAGGSLTTTAILQANGFDTSATGVSVGGSINLRGASIALGNDVTATGVRGSVGQGVSMHADGDISIVSGNVAAVDAGTANGDGGTIAMGAGGTIRIARPIKVHGTYPGATGGSISLSAERIEVSGDLMANGGSYGGEIEIEARQVVDLGSTATAIFSLNASGNTGGTGGQITITSAGNDVLIGTKARLLADDGQSGGEGGGITIDGVTVTAAANSVIDADGAVDEGGSIDVSARGQLTLQGALHANHGYVSIAYLCTASPCAAPPSIGTGVAIPFNLIPDPTLEPPCGDGILRAGVESCDSPELGGQTCQSLTAHNGTLACSDTCVFDTSDCIH